jgi:hypothetical protein
VARVRDRTPWIDSLADSDWLARGQVEDDSASAAKAGVQAELREVDCKIENLVAAVEAGGDPGALTEQLAKRTAERDALRARLAAAVAPSALKPKEIARLVEELGGISSILQEATPEERSAAYAALGLQLTYDDRTRQLRVTADLARVAKSVGGGTCTISYRALEAPSGYRWGRLIA